MKIIRAKHPQVIDMIKDQFTRQSEEYVEELKEAMKRASSIIYVLVAIEDEEIVAFLIGSADPRLDHAWIHQAWRDPSLEWDVADRMFLRFVGWVDEKDRKEIKAETKRSPGGFLRRWDFEVERTILSFKLTDQKELYDGRSARDRGNTDEVDDRGSTTSSNGRAGRIPEPADREG